jgi:hypothetical protein
MFPYQLFPIEIKLINVYELAVVGKHGMSAKGQFIGETSSYNQLAKVGLLVDVTYSTGTLELFPGGIITVIEYELFVFCGFFSAITYRGFWGMPSTSFSRYVGYKKK